MTMRLARTHIAPVVYAAVAVVSAGWLSAASFTVTRARWDSTATELRVEGTGRSGALVAISNADSGQALGSITVRESRWKFRKTLPASPCRVRAVSDGVTRTVTVQNAPAGCDAGSPTLSSLAISGP